MRRRAGLLPAGTNDSGGNTGPMKLEAIEDNLASMAELAKASGIRAVLAPVLDDQKALNKELT